MSSPSNPGQWPDPTYQPPGTPSWPSPSEPSPTPSSAPGWPTAGEPYPPQPSAPPAYPAYQTPPPAYGAVPGYGQPAPYVLTRPTNSMALAAMIVALAGLVTCIAFPVGAILGHVALKQVRQTGEQGEGYAKTGIIVGWIGTALGVLGCIAYIGILGFAVRAGNNLQQTP
ncbi:MAG TPA: DUF4190 domain-containing protein [Micromonosporaceae bacterium]|jgi:hypothetical protein